VKYDHPNDRDSWYLRAAKDYYEIRLIIGLASLVVVIVLLIFLNLPGKSLQPTKTVDSKIATLHLDPDNEGKQTLAGIDSDHDGVRDDVGRFIVLNYSKSQRTIYGGLQYARALQAMLLEPNARNDAAETAAINCLWGLLGESSETITDAIDEQQINTASRRAASVAADNAMAGNILDAGDLSNRIGQCTFDPTSLPN
jgi:hypothetical protein